MIRDRKEWAQVWDYLTAGELTPRPRPKIDFRRELLVDLSWAGYRGETMWVRRVVLTPTRIKVFVVDSSGYRGGLSMGGAVYAIPRLREQVAFIVTYDTYACLPEIWILCGVVDPPSPLLPGARCAPPFVTLGYAHCWPPGQESAAENRFPQSFDPSHVVSAASRLKLTELITLGNASGGRPAGLTAIHFVYGTVPDGIQKVWTIEKRPSFVDVQEYVGKVVRDGPGPVMDQVLLHVNGSDTSPGQVYAGPWDFEDYIARRDLALRVMANTDRGTVEALGEQILRAIEARPRS